MFAQMPDGALYFEQVYYPFVDGPADHSKLAEAFDEAMWTGIASPPGPLVGGPGGRKRLWQEPRGCGRGRTGPSSACSAATCWRSASSSTATTTSSCSWPASPSERTSSSTAWSRSTWRTWSTSSAAVGPYIDVILFGDDLGMQTGPQISPAMYREFFKPRHALMWQRAKELADVKVMLHCCGGVRELLPDLIDAGLDAINPCRSPAGAWRRRA